MVRCSVRCRCDHHCSVLHTRDRHGESPLTRFGSAKPAYSKHSRQDIADLFVLVFAADVFHWLLLYATYVTCCLTPPLRSVARKDMPPLGTTCIAKIVQEILKIAMI